MGVVIIPSDFVEGKSRVVPICIQDHDQNGNAIAYGWINAVVRAANGIRSLARTILLDEWRSSDSPTKLSKSSGPNTVITSAASRTTACIGMLSGRRSTSVREESERARVSTRSCCLMSSPPFEPVEFTKEIEEKDFFERLDSRLAARGASEVRELVRRALYDEDVDFETVFGKSKGAAKKQFQRTIGRVLRRL